MPRLSFLLVHRDLPLLPHPEFDYLIQFQNFPYFTMCAMRRFFQFRVSRARVSRSLIGPSFRFPEYGIQPQEFYPRCEDAADTWRDDCASNELILTNSTSRMSEKTECAMSKVTA
jgi:hypothetical protein